MNFEVFLSPGSVDNRMMDDIKFEIAQIAARCVVEEGLGYGPAKHRALKQLGLSGRTALPDNDQVEDAVREYIQVFYADTQPLELQALREEALRWMRRLQAYRPHLGGAVWNGTATRHSDIYLQLFCDDPKMLEIDLINQGVDYQVSTVTGFQGERVDALSVHSHCRGLNEDVGVHLLVYDADDLRGALKHDRKGRAARGTMDAVRDMVEGLGHDHVS